MTVMPSLERVSMEPSFMGCFEGNLCVEMSGLELYRGKFIRTSEFYLLIAKAFADNQPTTLAPNPAGFLKGLL